MLPTDRSINPSATNSDPFFGKVPFNSLEFESINKKLNDVEHHDISYRSGIGGTKLAYIEGWKLIKIANDIFGFNGWSTHILSMTTEFIDSESPGRINAGVSCHVRVTLKDGTFHEDIGFGSAENYKNKAGALEKAKKEAVTDATKRALRYFGYSLGLSTYDKEYLNDLGKPPANSTTSSITHDPHRLRSPLAGQMGGVGSHAAGIEMDYSTTNQQQSIHVTGMHYQPNGFNRHGNGTTEQNGNMHNSAFPTNNSSYHPSNPSYSTVTGNNNFPSNPAYPQGNNQNLYNTTVSKPPTIPFEQQQQQQPNPGQNQPTNFVNNSNNNNPSYQPTNPYQQPQNNFVNQSNSFSTSKLPNRQSTTGPSNKLF